MEVSRPHRRIPVEEASQPFAARTAARETAESAGFSVEDAYRAGLVVTELATNLVKHASGGEILVRHIMPNAAVEIIAVDRGPGIEDTSQSLADGYSTAGSSGTGLGAVSRLADDFDIYSQRGRGTVVLARLRASRVGRPAARRLDFAGVSIAKNGQDVCGDAWNVHQGADGALAVVADGLGHGLQASEASFAAIEAIDPTRGEDLAAVLEGMHKSIRHTRGAAAALAEIGLTRGVVRCSGIGNVATLIVASGQARHAVSLNGTLGYEARTFREYAYPWSPDAMLVMHSDGLSSHWSLSDYPGLGRHDPAIAAAVLYRDYSRQRDDVTVVVAREAA